ncbi:Positive regulator of purine utilization [Fusarium albosuccineum]|uniref:Positive regulator of purine utilization n=1 Tax=Fusarium albosuccineum TaxID=1237068 RepID=A0A8H4P8V1_9HYPO|nr:Positive regulator of purine utilization [Fusarium albosuccineum]
MLPKLTDLPRSSISNFSASPRPVGVLPLTPYNIRLLHQPSTSTIALSLTNHTIDRDSFKQCPKTAAPARIAPGQGEVSPGGEIPGCAWHACAVSDERSGYVSSLKRRISWLESIVRTRCPDVDLSQEPPPAEPDEASGEAILDDTTDTLLQSPVQMQTQNYAEVSNETIVEPSNQPVRSAPGPTGAGGLSHEIGLVSLGANQDPRYIGPSSGYFLARVMLDSASKQDERLGRSGRDTPFPTKLVEAIQGPLPLPSREMAKQLCDAYFDAIHLQYPILHQPTFIKMLDQQYEQDDTDPVAGFQIFMVLAIGATVLSGRLRAHIPAESYCLSALQYLEDLNLENSLQGVQCLLLLLIFTIHSPFVRLNVWYLNYHCIAALLDLGLQRNISINSGISLLEQEMRARIFWVIFSFDRIIATMMGRPIGLRDEACELRMPQGLNDDELTDLNQRHMTVVSGASKDMDFAMHLFRAAKLNSEIKYVANSINRDSPRYAYPPVMDIRDWQTSMLHSLDEWANQIPQSDGSSGVFLRTTCQIRYHGLRMLLLRPSPAIPKPSNEALIQCHESARKSIKLFDNLYRKNLLVHSWTTFHALVLSTITLLYCIKVVPEIARETEIDVLMGDLSISLSVLSATGEHWSGAKRSRDILDELGRSTIRRLRDNNGQPSAANSRPMPRDPPERGQGADSTVMSAESLTGAGISLPYPNNGSTILSMDQADSMQSFSQNAFDDFLMNDSFAEYFEATESINVDTIVRDLFQDFIPMYPSNL